MFKKIIILVLVFIMFSSSVLAVVDNVTACYLDTVRNKIYVNFLTLIKTYHTTYDLNIRWEINRNGKIIKAYISKPSSNKLINQAALKAVWLYKPIGPIPAHLKNTISLTSGARYYTTVTSSTIEQTLENQPEDPQGSFLSNNNEKKDNTEDQSLIGNVEKYEKILKINTPEVGLIDRINNVELLLFGSIQQGGLINRLDKIKTVMTNINNVTAKPTQNLPAFSDPSPIMPPNSNTPDFKKYNNPSPFIAMKQSSQDYFPKSPNNPINWQYQIGSGSYFRSLIFKNKNKDLGIPRFYKFPIKYWIQPMDGVKQQPIRTALSEYSYYFPMKEVSDKKKADLTIEIVTPSELKEFCNAAKQNHALACGGPSTQIQQIGYIRGFSSYKGTLKIDVESFKIKNIYITVLHELGHAFGITEHSDNPLDVMYAYAELKQVQNGEIYVKNTIGKLSPRDLNTLFLLYNQENM